jgi:hypothetical protein
MRTNDNRKIVAPEVTLRIPGSWSGPEELLERLPKGCRCTGEELILADGTTFAFNPLPADDEFPKVFAGSCPKRPTKTEQEQIENYQVNVCLTRRAGSIAAAKQLMAGAAAILEAGAAGVFVDNSGIAHGATDWFTLFNYRTLHSFLGYTAFSGAKLKEGEVVGDAVLPTFRVYSQPHDRFPADVPMFNPYGEWRLEAVDVQQN